MKEYLSNKLNSQPQTINRQNLWFSNLKKNILITIKMLSFLSVGFFIWLIAAVITVKVLTAT
ncbi:hypothetical protein QDR34_01775 [Acinetobacter baumannii]|uniref:hypothetical protein n=1 Tax=Acinetobacter baumannii TaxID=470 RepID=UPI0024488021|nr:hypothetical protein [Acinetobacter baumannii]MDH2466806.1 hypothetical protein [Acinetobacter baumannii]MDO7516759.1 hypothetical protein [Acinetobacter baumannii]HCH7477595.1 hypothetical protein [Acinetobacter baumannii]